MARIGPVVLETVGDTYAQSARVAGAVWEGATTVGDTVEIRCPSTNALLISFRANDTQTFMGAMVPPEGIHAPHGLKVTLLGAGRVLIYLKEG